MNATCDLDWGMFLAHLRAPEHSPPPQPTGIVRYDLGALSGIPLSFTDAARWRDATFYSASAEDSPDVTRDGRVMGSAVGVIESDGRTRWAPLTDPSGALFAGKVEGLLPADDTGDRLLIVVDADDPDAASELCTVDLRGNWSDE